MLTMESLKKQNFKLHVYICIRTLTHRLWNLVEKEFSTILVIDLAPKSHQFEYDVNLALPPFFGEIYIFFNFSTKKFEILSCHSLLLARFAIFTLP